MKLRVTKRIASQLRDIHGNTEGSVKQKAKAYTVKYGNRISQSELARIFKAMAVKKLELTEVSNRGRKPGMVEEKATKKPVVAKRPAVRKVKKTALAVTKKNPAMVMKGQDTAPVLISPVLTNLQGECGRLGIVLNISAFGIQVAKAEPMPDVAEA